MRWLDAEISAANGEHRVFLYRSHGASGQELSMLEAGTQPYRNGLLEIQRALLIARIYKKRVVVRAVTWSHGEADRKLRTAQNAYAQSLRALRAGYEQDIRKVTRQSEPVYLLVDQLSGSATGQSPSRIALAQLQAVEEDPFILMSCPKYFLRGDYGYRDNVHLKPLGYNILGEYHAKVWHHVFVEGRAWTGLRPKSIAISSPRSFDVEFWVPVEPLVLDTISLPKSGSEYGFRYEDDQGCSLEAGGVTILNGTTVRFVTTTEIEHHAGRTLYYAFRGGVVESDDRSGVWGNLRDSDPRPSIAVPGQPLSNWCVSFVRRF